MRRGDGGRCERLRAREVATISPRKFSVVSRHSRRPSARVFLLLFATAFERNEMLPRKLDRTGTNAHTGVGGARTPRARSRVCTDRRLADHLPAVAKDVESPRCC